MSQTISTPLFLLYKETRNAKFEPTALMRLVDSSTSFKYIFNAAAAEKKFNPDLFAGIVQVPSLEQAERTLYAEDMDILFLSVELGGYIEENMSRAVAESFPF